MQNMTRIVVILGIRRIALCVLTMPLFLFRGCFAGGERQELNDVVASIVAEGNFSGSVLVAQHGRILLHENYGCAVYETNELFSQTTQFRIGCISKQFTAVAIMQLEAKGLIALDADVQTYLPEFPICGVTIQHLLTMTDGLPRYWDIQYDAQVCQQSRYDLSQAIYQSAIDYKFSHQPGTYFENTHTGYELLCLIVERVSGLRFEAYMQKNIFDRIGMKQTECSFACCNSADLGVGYTIDGGIPKRYASVHQHYLPGATGLCSTAYDLHMWLCALKTPDLIMSTKSFEEMIMPRCALPSSFFKSLQPLSDIHYGYGLILATIGGKSCFGHFGKMLGFNNAMFYFPEEEASIIVLSNLRHAPVSSLLCRLASVLFKVDDLIS